MSLNNPTKFWRQSHAIPFPPPKMRRARSVSPKHSPTLPNLSSPRTPPLSVTSGDITITYDSSPESSCLSNVFTDSGTRASTASSVSATAADPKHTSLIAPKLPPVPNNGETAGNILANSLQTQVPRDAIHKTASGSPAEQAKADLQPLITAVELRDLWTHASLLAHNGGSTAAISLFQHILNRPGVPPTHAARLQLNIGILLTRLGQPEAAAESFYNAAMGIAGCRASAVSIEGADGEELTALAVMLLGNAAFDVGAINKAGECFEVCLSMLDGTPLPSPSTDGSKPNRRSIGMSLHNSSIEGRPSGSRKTTESDWARQSSSQDNGKPPSAADTCFDYARMGLAYTLERKRVRWNQKECAERETVERRTPMVSRLQWRLNTLPSNVIFEAPGHNSRSSGGELQHSTPNHGHDTNLEPSAHIAAHSTAAVTSASASTPARTKDDAALAQKRLEASRRRTRILIKLGDLQLNKPLPPLPATTPASGPRALPAPRSTSAVERAVEPMAPTTRTTGLRRGRNGAGSSGARALAPQPGQHHVDSRTPLGLRNVTW